MTESGFSGAILSIVRARRVVRSFIIHGLKFYSDASVVNYGKGCPLETLCPARIDFNEEDAARGMEIK